MITSGKCFVFSAFLGSTLDTIFASVYEASWEMTSLKCSYSALAARQWIRVHTFATELLVFTIFYVKVDTARAVRTRGVDIFVGPVPGSPLFGVCRGDHHSSHPLLHGRFVMW